MKEKLELLDIIQTALGTFEHRQSFAPGMFEPLKPLFEKLGYTSAAVYIADDYPDRMQNICGYGGDEWFPSYIVLPRRESLYDEFACAIGPVPGLMAERLFSHGRELGVLAVTTPDADSAKAQEAFSVLAQSVSIMAYVERIRTNMSREREERDIFFAHSLTNRLLIREAPKMRDLRLGFELMRSLNAGGDFFDLIPGHDGNLLGFFGCCSGTGLRTVLEVSSIMRVIHRSFHDHGDLSAILKKVNDFLIREKRRAHQASLCLFQINVTTHQLRIAKAGRLVLLLCGPGGKIDNISAPGATFLGMVDKPGISDEEYEFKPGQSLLCVTEGFYSSRNVLNVRPQMHWFLESLSAILESKRKKPLANAIFDLVNREADHTARPDESMLAVSVEFLQKKRDSVRR